jgi:hypothetical protein
MRGNLHVRFLGGGSGSRRSFYPTNEPIAREAARPILLADFSSEGEGLFCADYQPEVPETPPPLK